MPPKPDKPKKNKDRDEPREHKGGKGKIIVPIIVIGLAAGLIGALAWIGLQPTTPPQTGPHADEDVTYLILAPPTASGVCYAIPRDEGDLPAYSGTNESLIIQQALNATDDIGGGIVQLQGGTFLLDIGIEVFNHTTLRGEGDATILKIAQDMDVIISTDNVVDVEISHFLIDNRGTNKHADYGIVIYSLAPCLVEDITIYGANDIDYGIEAIGERAVISNCHIVEPSLIGIMVGGGNGVVVQYCTIEITLTDQQVFGIQAFLTLNTQIDSNYVTGASAAGIACGWVMGIKISSNVLVDCGNDSVCDEWGALHLDLASYMQVHDNLISGTPYDCIHMEDTTNSTFYGDVCTGYGSWDGIYCDSDCEFNLFHGEQAGSIFDIGDFNAWIGCFSEDGITISGANSVAVNVWGPSGWYNTP